MVGARCERVRRFAQMASGELAKMVEEAPEWLREWAENVGTDLASGMAENPGWNVFACEDGLVYHTYSRTAPDRFLSAYYEQLLDQVPNGRGAEFPLRRHDEYEWSQEQPPMLAATIEASVWSTARGRP